MTASQATAPHSEAVEQRRWIDVADRRVPAVVWTPTQHAGRRPLVLMGHGGSGHKTSQLVLDAALPLVRLHGFVVAAIDGPVHGERRASPADGEQVRSEFRALWAEGGSVEPMVADWRATLDELCRMPEVDPAAIGWYGISMGTAYGLPFVAAEPRIRAAVLGMWGTSRINSRRLVDDARRVSIPVLFQQKQDDEFFTPEGQVEIYEALASPEKQLAVYQGGHVDPSGLQLFDLIEFLATRLQHPHGRQQPFPVVYGNSPQGSPR
ncbi:putative dienelactone hydrolase [Variovorax sp. PBL-H6]|uniref:alpha/beta hydrolase n=1 Tax=Variovorax sp. PBL-H6 TaxID=434009 RepID=UPI001315E03D|nr:dienelactone hydrolase family protein [Variovorax sp. PBL-H6]VTU23065.1 putative dienelactone hydrolase [Variovorax sp. PBL-H6]